MDKFVQLKSYNDTGQETGNIYPITKAELVVLKDNSNLQQTITDIDKIKEDNQFINSKLDIVTNFKETDGMLTYKDKPIITDVKNILATQILETEDRKFLSSKEKQNLFGLEKNIQTQFNETLNLIKQKVRFRGRYNTYDDLILDITDPEDNDMVIVDNDVKNNSINVIYYYSDNQWISIKKDSGNGEGWIASNTEPINKQSLWLDISSADVVLRYFNGASWINISGLKEVPASKVIQSRNLRFVSDKSDSILSKLEENLENGKLMYDGKIIGNENNYIDDLLSTNSSTFSSNKINELLSKKQSALNYVAENASRKGKANGYAPLNELSKINKEFLTQYNYCIDSIENISDIISPEHGSICYVESTSDLYVYTTKNVWVLISQKDNDEIQINKSNYNSIRNPSSDDDELNGYSIGSLWINTEIKKAYICTNSEAGNAQWELMTGSSNISVGKIIDFILNPEDFLIDGSKYKSEIPKMDLDNDVLQIKSNNIELTLNNDYTLINNELKTYIIFKQKPTTQLIGKIYVKDVNDNQMLKSIYDINNNGKVDFAEVADKSKGFISWKSNTKYELYNLVSYNGTIYSCISEHISNENFEIEKWRILNSDSLDISEFTTNDLEPTPSRNYISTNQLSYVNMIPDIINKSTNNETLAILNKKDIESINKDIEVTNDKLANLKFTNLVDTEKVLKPYAFLRTDTDGKVIIADSHPLFPIKRIIDCTNKGYDSIDVLKFNNLEMINQSTEGIFTFDLNVKSSDLKDMPQIHEHGKVLISDGNNNKYVLADKEQLTMSIENFHYQILDNEWIEKNGKFETTIFHDMRSMNLLVSFTDNEFIEDKSITYQLLDDTHIKVFSNVKKTINCVINCALGAGNGYWQYIMDWKKIDFVDDSIVRSDRAYSSNKLNEILSSYCEKNQYYSKLVSDSKYAVKQLEHNHENKSILDSFSKDSSGNIMFENQRLLTGFQAFDISLEQLVNNEELTETYDFITISQQHKIQTILAAELLIKNISQDNASFQIRDGSFVLLDLQLKPNETQKYNLGISKKIKILTQGEVSTMLTISAL